MDERRLNIEEWLRQAADRQQGVRSSDAEKQQGWEQLHSMLDADNPTTGGRSWMGMVDIILLFLTGVLLVLPGMYHDTPKRENVYVHERIEDVDKRISAENGDRKNGHDKSDERNAENGDGKSRSDDGKSAKNGYEDDDERNAENEDRNGRSDDGKNTKNGYEDDDERNAENEDRKGRSNDGKRAENGYEKDKNEKSDGRNAENRDEKGRNDDRKSTKNGDRKDGGNEKSDEGNAENGDRKDESRKGINEKNVKSNGDGINIRQSKTAQATLSALSTKHLFPAKITRELFNAKQQRIPHRSSTTKIIDLPSSGFSLNLSPVLPADGQYGVTLAVEYNYRLWNSFFIRPRVGIGYIHTGTREYSHSAYFPRADTMPNPVIPYLVDSLVTDYSVKGILYGIAGLQVAYRYKKLEIFTGIAYRHQFMITGSGSSDTTSRLITGAPVFQREHFNKNRLPGKMNVQWQAGLNYMLNPRLQVGASYNLLLQKSAGQKGLEESAPAIPASSSVELQLRWFFRKK